MSNKGSVLIVDDDPDFLEYTRIVIESRGYRARTASTTDTALRLMQEEKPAVMLLDVMMSYVLDGWNIARRIRSDPALRDVPIIMISAIVSREEAGLFPTDEYLSIDSFMTKPVDPAELLHQIDRLVGRK